MGLAITAAPATVLILFGVGVSAISAARCVRALVRGRGVLTPARGLVAVTPATILVVEIGLTAGWLLALN